MQLETDPRILPVGGGKGGIGKSFIVSSLGSTLAQQGQKIAFLDADLGGANLHLFLGLKFPSATLADFISGKRKSLEDVLLDTPIERCKLVSGASDVLGLANPKFSQKTKLIRALGDLKADRILLDLGAGTHYNTLDFFVLSTRGILVMDAEITSMENAYGFLKTSVLRKIQRLYAHDRAVTALIGQCSDPRGEGGIGSVSDLLSRISDVASDKGSVARKWLTRFRPRLIINRVRRKEDVDVALRFCDIAKKYLNVQVVYVGYVAEDPVVHEAARTAVPIVSHRPDSLAMNCIRAIASNLVQLEERENTQNEFA